MSKILRQKFVLMLVLVLVFTLVIPFSSYASIKALTVPTVTDGRVQSLGTLFCNCMAGRMQVGDIALFSLPNDFKFVNTMETRPHDSGWVMDTDDWNTITVDEAVYRYKNGSYFWTDYEGNYKQAEQLPLTTVKRSVRFGNPYNYFEFPVKYNGKLSGVFTKNPEQEGYILTTGLFITPLDENELKLSVIGFSFSGLEPGNVYPIGPDPSRSVYFFIKSQAVYVDEGYRGRVYVNIDSPGGRGFFGGHVPMGKASDGEVTVSVEEDCNITGQGQFTLRFREDSAGAFADARDSISIELPEGFAFSDNPDIDFIWGDRDILDEYGFYYNDDEDELDIRLTKTNKATCIEITFEIEVVDETDVEHGDIEIDLGDSESDIEPDRLDVGTYGDYEAEIEIDYRVPKVFAGFKEQEIGTLVIEEEVAGSLIENRSVLLTLPANARWHESSLDDFDRDEGLDLQYKGLIGRDDRTAKFLVKKASNDDPAEITLEGVEVYLEAGKTGDLVVEVSGSAGLRDEIVVAKIIAPISVEAVSSPRVVIGHNRQPAGDIIITESKAGALNEDELELVLSGYGGIEFDGTPKVEVVNGDLEIGDVDVDDNVLTISIKDESKRASTIKISYIAYRLYRTIPFGDIEVDVQGPAVVETFALAELDDDFNTEEAARVVNAFCKYHTTVEPEEMPISITLGDKGSYISDGRMMVKLRDAAVALGVAEQNILWDGATKTVTLIKGDRVVQITVGEPQVKLNGIPLPTDKGAQIKDDRTYISLSAAAVAFGAAVEWDNFTKTATIYIK